MSNVYQFSEKKKILLKLKERLQNEINGVEQSIRDVKTELSRKKDFEDYSLDSDTEELFKLGSVPSMNERELKRQQTALRIRLHATEELTSLKVLQSEVNVMVEPPTLERLDIVIPEETSVSSGGSDITLKLPPKNITEATTEFAVNRLEESDDYQTFREPPVLEAGTWREVTADCRIDLVPFLITFYVHQPHRARGARSYRSLRVTPVKAAHERELRRSVLPSLARPAHAVEVIRNYATAHRSRRSTLARLADLYADTLHMELEPECGYVLRLAGALSLRWALVNEWSPVAPFHHSLKFDFEYLDEPYVRRLMQSHKKLSDPRIQTDERTALLAGMIDICLEARGPADASDDVESEQELVNNRRRRQSILDDEAEPPAAKKPKDSEVMAPPRAVPRRRKPKGKENNSGEAEPRAVKRAGPGSVGELAKKAKVNAVKENGSAEMVVKDKTKTAVSEVTEREKTVPAEKGSVVKIDEKTKILNIPAEKEQLTAPKKMKPVAGESDRTKKLTVAEKSRPVDKVIGESNNVSEKTATTKAAKQNALAKTSVKEISAEGHKLAAKVSAQDQNVVSKISKKVVVAEKTKSAAKATEKNQHAAAAKPVSSENTKTSVKVRAQNQNVANSAEKNNLAVKLSDKNKKAVAKTTSKADSVKKNVLMSKLNEKDRNVVSQISENVVSVEKTKSAVELSEKTKSSAIGDHKNVTNTINKEKITVAEIANSTFNLVEKDQNAKALQKTIGAVGLNKKTNSAPNVESKVKVIDKSKYNVNTTTSVPTKKASGLFASNIKAKLPENAVAASKSVANTNKKPENAETGNSADIFRKSINKALVNSVKNSNSFQINNKQPIKSKIPSLASIKTTRAGNTPPSTAGRAIGQNAKQRVVSKIPQKKYPTPVFSKQNPARISPRRLPLPKPGLSASVTKLAKPSWTSPRQLKKPE